MGGQVSQILWAVEPPAPGPHQDAQVGDIFLFVTINFLFNLTTIYWALINC